MFYEKWEIINELQRKAPLFNYRNVIEAVALLEDKKKVMRLVVNDSAVPLIVSSLEKLGFAVACSKSRLKTAYSTCLLYTSPSPRD